MKYKTNLALSRAVDRYFASISRTVTATERVDTGERDSKGHVIYTNQEILNDDGEPIRYREYVLPPTVGALCDFLGIHRATWADYSNPELHPEFLDTTSRARERMRTWNEHELVTRRDVKGIIFNLTNNYEYRDRREMELGTRAAKALSVNAMSVAEKAALLEELRREALEEDGDEDAAGGSGGTGSTGGFGGFGGFGGGK